MECNATPSQKNECVANRNNIEVELVKLPNGVRLLRFTQPKSGLTLERKLDPNRPVSDQKDALAKVFPSALTQAHLAFRLIVENEFKTQAPCRSFVLRDNQVRA